MSKTHKERVLDYLWSISPNAATNAQIREATAISSHQTVYMLTQELLHSGLIQGEQRGREWFFWADDSLARQLFSPGRASYTREREEIEGILSPQEFERLAQAVMSRHFGGPLAAGSVPGVSKKFDLTSPDRDIVGDAKYFTLVWGQRLPPAKFSVVAEHVWLLEKTGAPVQFLVFGNDRQVPLLWLERYGELVGSVAFYFLSDDGELELLHEPPDQEEDEEPFCVEEWDQQRASRRSIEAMRRIARDAMKLDDAGFYTYAAENDLTVNEVVYYLNAYEAGKDAGLQAIHNPDIIPADVARMAIEEIDETLKAHFEGRVPYRITDEGTAISVYHVQQRSDGKEYLFEVCQFRLTVEGAKWHLYWMRKFDAWWPYPLPEVGRKFSLRARVQQVLEDEYGCFWI
jgi:hypothetical protein